MTPVLLKDALPPELAPILAIVEKLAVLLSERAEAPAATTAPVPAWVTLEQASELSGLSVGLLRRLSREGKLKSIRDVRTKVRRADVEGLEL